MTDRQPAVETLSEQEIEALRRMTPGECSSRFLEIWEATRHEIRTLVSQEHPDWSDADVLREVAHIISGDAAEVLRRMTPEERQSGAFEAWEARRDQARASVQQDHGDWTEAEVLCEVARVVGEKRS